MKTVSEFPFEVEVTPHTWITLADGRRLSAKIWRPIDAGPLPAILEYLPYRKRDGTAARDGLNHPWLSGHGYVCVRVDIAGTGESEGLFDDEYSARELADGVEVINWIAAQDWCDGGVGMTGISWGGFNGLQLAALAPEPLKAVVSICSTVDRFADDIHYKGGCMLGENTGWAATVLGWFGLPPDPEIVGNGWADIWRTRLEETPMLAATWLRHQVRDEYWRHGSVCEDYSAIKAAVLTVGGWHDGYRNTISHLVSNLDAPVKGIVGPWDHSYPHFAMPGPQIGFLQEMKRWYDHWLKDEDTGVDRDPAYRAYLMDGAPPDDNYQHREGRWIAEQEWPSRNIEAKTLHLSDAGLSGSDKSVSPRSVGTDLLCGEGAAEYFPFGFEFGELSGDQQGDDSRSMCFDAAPSDTPVEIVGAPVLNVRIAPDQCRAQMAARLCDVGPDGASTLITQGFLNLAQARGHDRMLDAREAAEGGVTLSLDQCAYRLPAGHRLRLAISPSYWPYVWPEAHAVTLTVEGGELSLPIRPLADGPEWTFEAAEASAPPKTVRFFERDDRKSWTTTEDGLRQLSIQTDSGEVEDQETGLAARIQLQELWSIDPDDPCSARSEFSWTRTLRRGSHNVKTIAYLTQTADESHFHVTARLQAFDHDEAIFDKTWRESVPRA
ncbi:MAG: CocE/NonD family hydrolase [Pseudomonadota bacterium]